MKHGTQSHWGLGRAIALSLSLGIAALVEGTFAGIAHSAERVRFLVGGPVTFSLSVESLEVFAETGEIRSDLRQYTQFASDDAVASLRQLLQRPFPLDGVTLSNLGYSPLGRDALSQVGEFIRVSPEVNGFNAIRAAAINAAVNNTDPAGWTAIDVLHAFPTDQVDIQINELLAYWRTLNRYADYNEAMVRAIATVADREAAESVERPDFSALPNLSQPGPYMFQETTITVTNPALRQTGAGLSVNYAYDVDAYIPQGLLEPAPIVIISHGFGALKENFIFMAEHLASHGFVVLVPDHVGSNLSYRQNYLQGQLNTLLSPMEFIGRPQEISFLIDELERLVDTDPQWAAVFNLEQIGVMGDSLGSTSVFSLVGAEFNFDRLAEQCRQENRLLNFSLYLQCRAQYLPTTRYDLEDERIQAAIAAHSFGYGLFGPDEVAAIDTPLMMVAGSYDIVAPVVIEQFYPFIWLQSDPKYLALLTPGSHFSTKPEGAAGATGLPPLVVGQYGEFGQSYYKTLTVAFFNRYLRQDTRYDTYLSAAYGRYLSEGAPMALDLIQSLTETDIETAYGRRPWIALDQPTAAALPDESQPSVLAEIADSRLLRVGLRRDAPPFGFLSRENAWVGYCIDFTEELRSHLETQLDISVGLEVVELSSTLENRFDLVRAGDVHLECGPNTIRSVEGVTFSRPIFTAATRFLIQTENAEGLNPNLSLEGVALGVLPNTTTAAFVEERYPDANIVYFEGLDGRSRGVQAVADGSLAAFVGDDILSIGEATELNLRDMGLTLVPELPLTCEFYGLLLPAGDEEWQRTVNRFVEQLERDPISTQWFQDLASLELNNLDDCLNR